MRDVETALADQESRGSAFSNPSATYRWIFVPIAHVVLLDACEPLCPRALNANDALGLTRFRLSASPDKYNLV